MNTFAAELDDVISNKDYEEFFNDCRSGIYDAADTCRPIE